MTQHDALGPAGGAPGVHERRQFVAADGGRPPDTVLFTVPNQLGVDNNTRILATIARHVAPAIGWSPASTQAAA